MSNRTITYNDGRPCPTDVFLGALKKHVEDVYDRDWAINEWLHGDWNEALSMFEGDEAKPLRNYQWPADPAVNADA